LQDCVSTTALNRLRCGPFVTRRKEQTHESGTRMIDPTKFQLDAASEGESFGDHISKSQLHREKKGEVELVHAGRAREAKSLKKKRVFERDCNSQRMGEDEMRERNEC